MTRLAITGHRGLPAETTRLVDAALREEMLKHSEIVGLSCLADGADSLFAQAVLDLEGVLVAVVPAAEYRNGLPESHHVRYDDLLRQASDTIRLEHSKSTSESHMDASLKMIDLADVLVAVWDGKPARGYGGTADVVQAARNQGLPVTVIWPDGAERG